MKTLDTYKASLIISCVFLVLFWFSPWWSYESLDYETQSILAFRGHGAYFSFPTILFWLYLAAMLVGYIGMFLYIKSLRTVFISATVFGIAILPLAGLNVITGTEAFLADISTLLAGVAIGLSFSSNVSESFH